MAKRKAAKASTKKPTARKRGITKAQGEFVHKLHTGKLSKRELDAASPRPPRSKGAPADVAPRNGQHGWTADLDHWLRLSFSERPRTAIATFARENGIPRGVVKARARQ